MMKVIFSTNGNLYFCLMNAKELIKKYNVPGPRYTSYPTVPFWKKNEFKSKEWLEEMTHAFKLYPDSSIGIYIHLPFCESLCTFCGCHKRITKNHAVESPYSAWTTSMRTRVPRINKCIVQWKFSLVYCLHDRFWNRYASSHVFHASNCTKQMEVSLTEICACHCANSYWSPNHPTRIQSWNTLSKS